MRSRRIKINGRETVYHCISRTTGGDHLLDQRANEVLRRQIGRVSKFCGVQVLTYCLMSNHIHILIRVPVAQQMSDDELLRRCRALYVHSPHRVEAITRILAAGGRPAQRLRRQLENRMHELSAFMKELKQRFTLWYNREYCRFGTLWAERFKSVIVDADSLAIRAVAAYIDLNPLRAGLCREPSEYRFCGYAEALGGFEAAREGISFICRTTGWQAAQRSYRSTLFGIGALPKAAGSPAIDQAYVRRVIERGGRLPMEQLLQLRVRYFSDGMAIGNASFLDAIFAQFRKNFSSKRRSALKPMKGFDRLKIGSLRGLQINVFD